MFPRDVLFFACTINAYTTSIACCFSQDAPTPKTKPRTNTKDDLVISEVLRAICQNRMTDFSNVTMQFYLLFLQLKQKEQQKFRIKMY